MLRASFGPIVTIWLLNSFRISVGSIIDTSFTFSFYGLTRSTFNDCLPGLLEIGNMEVKAVLIICLHSLSYFRIYHIVLFFKISTNQRNRWINML